MAKITNIEEKRVKPIILHDEETGEEYVLEFNRESVMFAESKGFDVNDVPKKMMTKVPEWFYYAFRMHHRNVSREKTDKILFEKLGGIPDGMIERLGELWAVPFESLVNKDEPGKNLKMTVEM